jgi:hypothetical protein
MLSLSTFAPPTLYVVGLTSRYGAVLKGEGSRK